MSVAETLLDLLDLYTHHRMSTSIGPLYSLEKFIDIRIALNQEASAANIPRYALYASEAASQEDTNGATPKAVNGNDKASPFTPVTPGTISPSTLTSATGIRGQNGTVRFMLDAERANQERAEVDRYYKVEEEEYEVAVDTEESDRRAQQPSPQQTPSQRVR
jgi:CTD kinase subunit beta